MRATGLSGATRSNLPLARGWRTGIPHREDAERRYSHNVRHLGVLRGLLAGMRFHSNRVLRKAFPNLQPASGGERVQYGALGCASEVLDRVFPPPLLADEPLLAEVRPRWRAFAHAHVQDVECRLVMRLETRPL